MSTRGSGAGNAHYWKSQPPVDYLDDTLTIDTWETVSADLSGGMPAKLLVIIVEQTNNGATAETIELEMTIDGTAYTFTINANSGTKYYCVLLETLTAGDFTPNSTTDVRTVSGLDPDFASPFYAGSVGLIRVRQTTTVDGTSAQIEVNIMWEKLTRYP